MNQAQIDIARKIQNKNKNLKHGKLNPDVFYKEALERELGLKSESDNQNYKEMINIMKNIDQDKSVEKLNNWLSSREEIFNKENEGSVEYKFYQICQKRLNSMGLEPKFTINNKNMIAINENKAMQAKMDDEPPRAPTIKYIPKRNEPLTPTVEKIPKRIEPPSPTIRKNQTKTETKNQTINKNETSSNKNETKNLTNEEIIDMFQNMYHNCFRNGIKKPLFMEILQVIIRDGRMNEARDEIINKINTYKTKSARVTAIWNCINSYKIDREPKPEYKPSKWTAGEIDELANEMNKSLTKSKIETKFENRNAVFDEFRTKLDNYMNVRLPEFEKGDKIPKNINLRGDLVKLIKSVDFKWNNETKRKINNILYKYGFRINSMSKKTGNTIGFDDFNKEYKKDLKDRANGKVETDPVNSKEFFSYDIHEIFNIVERGLETKLSNEVKNDIESIIRTETSNMINHLNISHGTSKVQSIIEQIENYLSSRIKNKTKKFKFTESNRYKLKELLSRFLNTKNNGQE